MDNKTEKRIQEVISKALEGDISAFKQIASFSHEDRENFNYLLSMNLLWSQSSKFRGKVIDISIFLEMVLSQILSEYFTDKNKVKENLLNSFVFDRMMISTKLNLLKRILKRQHPEVWNDHGKEIKEIGELLEFRNNLAHSLLNTSDGYVKSITEKILNGKNENVLNELEEIEVVYFEEDSLKKEVITKKQIDNYYKVCSEKIKILQEISNRIQ